MNLAPICLFTYKRLDCTVATVEALKKNYLASDSQLFIFSDEAKKEEDKFFVKEVRTFNRSIKGFKDIQFFEKEKNTGLANSIIGGVTQIVNQFGKVIVIEDDLITTPNFLNYMNKALDFYETEKKIFSVAGYTIPMKVPKYYQHDVYAIPRASPWGWASWADRWNTVDWKVSDYQEFAQNKELQKQFNQGGSDLTGMLTRQMSQKLDSWAIRWGYQQFKNNQITIFPTVSKVRNIGFGPDATHTKFYDRYRSELDYGIKTDFKFIEDIKIDPNIHRAYLNKYSLKSRLIGRLKHYLGLP